MKIIHSLWTKPLFKEQQINDFDRFMGGWSEKKYNYMSWTLSCLQFKTFYDEVELYTDEYGKEILIDQLDLPYTKVHIVLDTLNNYDFDLWAIGKIYTYSKQKEPFLHVDGDAFIWEKFDEEIENADLVVQNKEINFPYYKKSLNEIFSEFSYIPSCIKKLKNETDFHSINAGIFGGNDTEFIREYTKEAFKFIDKNINKLNQINIGIFNTVFEQLLFYNIVKQEKKKLIFFKKNVNEKFEGLAEFNDVKKYTKYIHVVGDYKKNKEIGQKLERRLLISYPEYYFKIIELLKKNQI